jgi:acyl carrier protein
MTNLEIKNIIVPFLVEEFEVEEFKIQDDANLREVLQLDSLDYVDLVVVIEGNFGFKVKQGDFKEIVTFADFYNYVGRKIKEKFEEPQLN